MSCDNIKATKLHMHPANTQISLGITGSDQSFPVHLKDSFGSKLPQF